ncbi:BREX-1 system adenine-specific DNA-methyltransferase PglX [Azospirillum brasilense]|uniref:site-specific DNA-methyltransferase (adenine-specific) n=1 Tax=Azospirillum brasilense TaxID=192 RepID=A0A235HHK0_AZOBR|nr:BREX-1 system adenine-specific DNA-methyltransferase PglX [Azospirillum brasilense]OYD85308.1 hypothetical protein CHT98_04465 [Azospirillum brasilense]
MNRNKLKTYAPKARLAFIQAVTARASKFGITASKIEPVQVQGDVALIGGQAYPRKVAEQRRKLEERIGLRSFEQVMEEAAYTWFNRFAAIRFMEIHGYLDHGYRVLSHPEGKVTPEIIEHAEHIDLPGLDREKVIDLKLDGTKDEELYRMLLTAQCNALHAGMPFLFESIDDETELLLPNNLLHSDSPIRQMVSEIGEADWEKIEIIGWLYQFYISDRNEEVSSGVVKEEDIPAATQLFTPNWIAKYMVHNSLGAMWLESKPLSRIRPMMDYYIAPAEQPAGVKDTLAEVEPTQLDPEEITFLDPACGSGHILVEAYDLFKEIYLDCGYTLRDIPKLILERNLYGFDIDNRAAQLASFAILMKAREDDPRIVRKNPEINVFALQEYGNFEDICSPLLKAQAEIEKVNHNDIRVELKAISDFFESANTFGSLKRVSRAQQQAAQTLRRYLDRPSNGSSLQHWAADESALTLSHAIRQVELLARQYDVVVANPPYMGAANHCDKLKRFLRANFNDYDRDLFSSFIVKNISFCREGGYIGTLAQMAWMFISSYEALRAHILKSTTIFSLVQLEYDAFEYVKAHVCAFVVKNTKIPNYKGTYIKLSEFKGAPNQGPKTLEAVKNRNCGWLYEASEDEYRKLPGMPIAYWLSDNARRAFQSGKLLGEFAKPMVGMRTGDNARFLRLWHEVSLEKTSFECNSASEAMDRKIKWVPFIKGGDFRRWYGNKEYVVNWENNGEEIKEATLAKYPQLSRDNLGWKISNEKQYFRRGITWTAISSVFLGVRALDSGCIFGTGGSCLFPPEHLRNWMLSFLCSNVSIHFLNALNSTTNINVENISSLPILFDSSSLAQSDEISDACCMLAKRDWDSYETSWDFQQSAILFPTVKGATVEESFLNWDNECRLSFSRMKSLEEESNRLFISLYGLENELSPTVPDAQITLAQANRYKDTCRLLSYSIGCMLGRYSVAEPGLIYASSGNAGFDATRYGDFPADDDGIIPITEAEWFSDDAANRFAEFLKVAWSPETLKENLKFVADSLGSKANETPMDTIRRYLSRDFYKDHLKTYKKRPIYWLFSSGKEKAFECLVYLHRYNESTLSRMRMEYVTPLQGRVSARIEQLDRDIQAAATTAAQNKLRKEQEKLKKQQAELIKFDDELRHYADKRIKLDLDDGVKVNYGKFGNLLAEVKTVTGGSDE